MLVGGCGFEYVDGDVGMSVHIPQLLCSLCSRILWDHRVMDASCIRCFADRMVVSCCILTSTVPDGFVPGQSHLYLESAVMLFSVSVLH